MTDLARLRERVLAGAIWFDGRPEKERKQLAIAVGAGMLMLWLLLLHQPFSRQQAELESATAVARAESDRLKQQLDGLMLALANDPRSLQRTELARLETEVSDLAQSAAQDGSSALPPHEVVALLRELLAKHPDLRLVRMQSLAAEAVEMEFAGPADAPQARVYRHPVEIELEGAYLPALGWLEAVAALPWRLHWDELRYEVTRHPQARIVLRLHMLGREEEWIRA